VDKSVTFVCLPVERWLPAVGYEGYYEVSDFGRVRSLPRRTASGLRGGQIRPGSPSSGHLAVGLSKDGRRQTVPIAQMVMQAFRGPRPPGNVIRHGPGGAYDNRLVNLRYGTFRQNSDDQIRDGSLVCGDLSQSAKLTQDQVDVIRRRYLPGAVSQRQLAEEFGVQRQAISKIVNGIRWQVRASDLPLPKPPQIPTQVVALSVPRPVPTSETAERWLPVAGWEGLYEVSDLGRVRSIPRQTPSGVRGGSILRGAANAGGYWTVSLIRRSRQETWRVHHLVMAAFVGPQPDGMVVRHGRSGKLDNSLANLCYGTHQQNSDDQLEHGTRLSGEAIPWSKLTWLKIEGIRERHSRGERISALASEHGVTPASIRKIVTGKSWARPADQGTSAAKK